MSQYLGKALGDMAASPCKSQGRFIEVCCYSVQPGQRCLELRAVAARVQRLHDPLWPEAEESGVPGMELWDIFYTDSIPYYPPPQPPAVVESPHHVTEEIPVM